MILRCGKECIGIMVGAFVMTKGIKIFITLIFHLDYFIVAVTQFKSEHTDLKASLKHNLNRIIH